MSRMRSAYEVLIEVEDDCKEAIQIARDLKKGLLFNSLSDEAKREKLDKIIEILER